MRSITQIEIGRVINASLSVKVIIYKKKEDYSCNPSSYIGENSKHLRHTVDDSVIPCDEVIDVMDIASTTMINSIAANATSGVSTNYHKLS